MKWGIRIPIAAFFVLLGAAELLAGRNLVRNGSFEGSLGYWLDLANCSLVRGGAADGEYYLRFSKDGPRTTAFPLPLGKPVSISLWIRSDCASELEMRLVPSCRDVAESIQTAWQRRMFTAKAERAWKRVRFDYTPTAKPWRTYWPESNYILWVCASGPMCVDAVNVVEAGGGEAMPRRELEVVTEVVNLPGYRVNGNLLQRGFKADVRAAVHNSTRRSRAVTLRWQLMDYEGVKPLSGAIDRTMLLRGGKTAIDAATLAIDSPGLTLARVSVLDEARALVDKSDAPLTILPFPKRATAPDPRERFGASLTGPLGAELMQAVGFRWSRWWEGPMAWDTVEKTRGVYDWPDEMMEQASRRGFCVNYVMYELPKWARGPNPSLPEDMQWKPEDGRWDDLNTKTMWDRFVTALVKRYANRNVVWEFQNEPELWTWGGDAATYTALARRTSRLVKQANPNAYFLVNCNSPDMTTLQYEFLKLGGARFIDCFSYHHYSAGELTGPGSIAQMKNALRTFGNDRASVWFNEGWTFANSSRDDAALAMTGIPGPELAHMLVRNMADLLAAGQEKVIGFRFAGSVGSRSWWDWHVHGTALWDDQGDPTTAVSAWNVLIDQLGLGHYHRTIRPEGAVLHVFQDDRNGRGVVVAYAGDGPVRLDLPLVGVIQRSVMGQDAALPAIDRKTPVLLQADRRPCFLFSSDGMSAADLAGRLDALDETATDLAAGREVYRPPAEWSGKAYRSAESNPWLSDRGQPLWRVDYVDPGQPLVSDNYHPMVWNGVSWGTRTYAFGGMPTARMDERAVALTAKGPWQMGDGQMLPALAFIAPRMGQYRMQGRLDIRFWAGEGPVAFDILKRDPASRRIKAIKTLNGLRDGSHSDLGPLTVVLDGEQELLMVPTVPSLNTAATYWIKDLKVSRVQAE